MDKPRFRTTPEDAVQEKIIIFLNQRGWMVEKMHGNAFQKGIPDLYCWNAGLQMHRWIDVKVEGRHEYTKSQCQKWPKWEKNGLGVWIMMDATEEWYAKLFEPHNFWDYWKPRYNKYIEPIEDIISDILEE